MTNSNQQTVTLADVQDWLQAQADEKHIVALKRYGITAEAPYGVSVGELKRYAKQIGKSHELARKLWSTQRYEPRMLAAFVDEPGEVTLKQMNQWGKDFDNWAVVDHTCFHLFDRTEHAWKQVQRWATAKSEFEKRGAFALLWALSVHDKSAPNSAFENGLTLITDAAEDDRHFVKKAVNMALRAIGKRNPVLRFAAIGAAERLMASENTTARWIGRDASRELQGRN